MEMAKLQRDRLVDAVYQSLRQAILDSSIPPSERLNVEELAQKLGVSLTPVRHAVQQLATEGLLEIKPRSGTFVTQLSAQNVEETLEIRRALECLAAETVVDKITHQDLRRLRELLKSLRKPVRSDRDRAGHDQDNSEFHCILIRASGNQRLAEIYETLNTHLKIARIHAPREDWLSRLDEEQAEHEEIVDALERRDADAAKQALTKHIRRAKDVLVAGIVRNSS
jgi:DNA-binding GntR family transcriptional regulator